MDQEQRQNAYRTLDATFGLVETQMRVVHELRLLRHSMLEARRSAQVGRFTSTLVVLVAGVPALYAILPESQQKIWPWVLAIVAILYAIYVAVTAFTGSTDDDALRRFDAKYVPTRPEHTPEFILMRIGATGTRLSLLKDIIKQESDQIARAKFENARDHWTGVLDRIRAEADNLKNLGAIGEKDMERIKTWLEKARA